MTKNDLKNLSNDSLLSLYESFVKWYHYEATSEFDPLREMKIDYFDLRNEVKDRLDKK